MIGDDGDKEQIELTAPDEALADRLRGLEWPRVQPEVRARCWEEFAQRLSHEQGGSNTEAPQRRNAGRQERYTRRTPMARDPLRGYGRVERAWSTRARPQFASSR